MATLGVHRAVVLTTADPAGAGRVRLKIPHIFGDTPTDWVEPHLKGGQIPKPGSTVWVLFQGGDTSKPVWLALDGKSTWPVYANIAARDADNPNPVEGNLAWTTDNFSLYMYFNGSWQLFNATHTHTLSALAVTINTTQTITGDKNFTGALTKGGQAVVTTDDPRLAASAQTVRNDLEIMIAMGGF